MDILEPEILYEKHSFTVLIAHGIQIKHFLNPKHRNKLDQTLSEHMKPEGHIPQTLLCLLPYPACE